MTSAWHLGLSLCLVLFGSAVSTSGGAAPAGRRGPPNHALQRSESTRQCAPGGPLGGLCDDDSWSDDERNPHKSGGTVTGLPLTQPPKCCKPAKK
jgi:hypothetical protein